MTSRNNEGRETARQLFLDGFSAKDIAERLSLPVRTIYRWISQLKSETFSKLSRSHVEPTSTNKATPPARMPDTQVISLNMAPHAAARLLALSESAISTIEKVLDDPDSSPATLLRAAQIVGKWTGLEERASVIANATRKFEVTANFIDNEAAELHLTHNAVEKKQDIYRRAAEDRKKRARMQYDNEQEVKMQRIVGYLLKKTQYARLDMLSYEDIKKLATMLGCEASSEIVIGKLRSLVEMDKGGNC